MQSAFVDIGLDRTAFLYISDIAVPHEYLEDIYSDESQPDSLQELSSRRNNVKSLKIEDLLREGQDIVVQAAKEPLGSKGARLTSNISLAGRHLVYLPTVNHIGVSRRIENEQERERLRAIAEKIKPAEGGIIVRTVAKGKNFDAFIEDFEFLTELWRDIAACSDAHCYGALQRAPASSSPSLLLLENGGRGSR